MINFDYLNNIFNYILGFFNLYVNMEVWVGFILLIRYNNLGNQVTYLIII